ncbi:MAG: hypothetical protein GEU99_12000 [Luteitalea sp.]|nr:hypothetical protein [Luteitalea sp.]
MRRPDNLKEDRKVLSPPVIEEPLCQCALSVTVHSYEPNATIEVDVSGTITSAPGGFPYPHGVTIPLATALVAGQQVRARQKNAVTTRPRTAAIVVRDHTADSPPAVMWTRACGCCGRVRVRVWAGARGLV